MKYLLIITSIIVTLTGIGCVALSQFLTPAEIDQKAVGYVAQAGIADANEFAGWPNMVKAEKLKHAVDTAHEIIQLDLSQMMDKDNMIYAHLSAVAINNYEAAVSREEILFGEKGLLSLGLSMAGFGTLTGALGWLRKRPQDLTQDEVDKLLTDVTGKTKEELTEKEKALTQIVLGVQKFIDTYSNAEAVSALKNCFQQDLSTRTAVAEIKAANPA